MLVLQVIIYMDAVGRKSWHTYCFYVCENNRKLLQEVNYGTDEKK